MSKDKKTCYIGGPEGLALDHAVHIIEMAYNSTCYLVGSALERPDFRDVDVRLILDDKDFEGYFGKNWGPRLNPLWSLTCLSLSEYLSTRTGLRVDFQIQKRSKVKESDWNKNREPLGFFYSGFKEEKDEQKV